jgi:RHS repeat-associated protein
VYDEQGHLLGEYDATGTPRQETIYLGDLPVAVIKPGVSGPAVYYVYADHLHAPRVLTRASDQQMVWRWDHADPFGLTPPDENPSGLGAFTYNLRFPGQVFDKETNNHYNYFRNYDPQTGRYVQSDPIGIEGGINTYSYVNMNPLRTIDQYGLFDMPALPQGAVNFSAGLGDALLFGMGGYLRDLADVDGGVDACSTSYKAGAWSSFGLGVGRLAYAGIAKAGSVLAASGAEASAFRQGMKGVFRLGAAKNWRPPDLSKYPTDEALRAAAGRTNPGMNAYGAGVAAAGVVGATCGCPK